MPRGSDALCSMTLSASIDSPPGRVGVVGPGLMGLGIAQAFAAAGVNVILCGRDEEAARRGRERLAASVARQAARGRIDASDETDLLARVEATAALRGLSDCAMVVESVPEDRALKIERPGQD